MSKLIYICTRSSRPLPGIEKKLEIIAERITPDNIASAPVRIRHNNGITYAIINAVQSIKEMGSSVVMGMLFPDDKQWDKPLGICPDGSFAIFRADEETVEVLTDVVASRTVWYFKNEEIFIASTSQRAIVMLLGDFKFNHKTISWILSSGSLGPNNSWDARINPVPADSSLVLERNTWKLVVNSTPVKFNPVDGSDEHHGKVLKDELIETFKSLKLDYSKWVLPLSGGYDSRLILCLLNISKKIKDLKSITWGMKSAQVEKGNDAHIGKKLADHFNINNTYYNTDISSEQLEVVLRRFLVCGEGRIDHISGYLDGFALWKNLFEIKVEGIIRGDVGFTSKAVEKPNLVRLRQGFGLCSDFDNLRDYESYGIAQQNVPERFFQIGNETLEQWRDRLYQEFRIPIVLAALTDLKLSYVEVVNPLLTKNIIYKVRQLPDRLRNKKSILKRLVKQLGPKIEMATDVATADMEGVLKSKKVIALLTQEFSNTQHSVIPKNFSSYIISNIKTSEYVDKRFKLKAILKRILPTWIKRKAFLFRSHNNIDFNLLLFRMYTIQKMHSLLTEDIKVCAMESSIRSEFNV